MEFAVEIAGKDALLEYWEEEDGSYTVRLPLPENLCELFGLEPLLDDIHATAPKGSPQWQDQMRTEIMQVAEDLDVDEDAADLHNRFLELLADGSDTWEILLSAVSAYTVQIDVRSFPMKQPGNTQQARSRISENGLFWIALILLSMGAITTFYYQGNIAMRAMSRHVYIEVPAAAPSGGPVLTLYDPDTGVPQTVITLDAAGAVSDSNHP